MKANNISKLIVNSTVINGLAKSSNLKIFYRNLLLKQNNFLKTYFGKFLGQIVFETNTK